MKQDHGLFYSVYATPHPKQQGETYYHVRNVTLGRQAMSRELMEALQQNTRVNTSQFQGTMEALRSEIPFLLSQGKPVHLDGIGTFYPKLGIRKRKDADGHWYTPKFTSPEDIKASDVVVKGIGFKADPTWSKLLLKTPGTVGTTPYAGHGVTIDRGKLLLWIDETVKRKGFVTVRDLRMEYDTTRYQAQQLLSSLCEGDQPKLYREKAGSTYLYRRWGKQ